MKRDQPIEQAIGRTLPQARSAAPSQTVLIISTVSLTFIAFLTVALPLAVLPLYVRNDLGWGTVTAGCTVSLQYVATVLSRSRVGQMSDAVGPKLTVLSGLIACLVGGGFMIAAALSAGPPALSLGLLLMSRLALGIGESLVGTGAIAWAIGLVGPDRTARIISWNGIATYGALALGAPLGVALVRLFGFWSIGASVMILALIGWLLALRHKTVPTRPEPRLKASQVLGRVLPHGLILGLATLGFGTITTFVSLFFDARGWPGAAFALTSFGLAFMLIRLLLADAINRQGGLKVARVSLVFQGTGLLLLWWSGGPGAAISAAALTGAGFALVFPALGVEAIAQVPAQNRGAALGLYSMFLDIGLGFTGPAAGFLANTYSVRAPFLCGAIATFAGLALSGLLRAKRVDAA